MTSREALRRAARTLLSANDAERQSVRPVDIEANVRGQQMNCVLVYASLRCAQSRTNAENVDKQHEQGDDRAR